MEFDVSLTHSGDGRRSLVNIPAPVSRKMREEGFDRCKIRVVPDGLLLVPYVSGRGEKPGLVLDFPEGVWADGQ